jgi:hypothetical protein
VRSAKLEVGRAKGELHPRTGDLGNWKPWSWEPSRFEEVREGGLEPPRETPPDPKSGASASSATLACRSLGHSNASGCGAEDDEGIWGNAETGTPETGPEESRPYRG